MADANLDEIIIFICKLSVNRDKRKIDGRCLSYCHPKMSDAKLGDIVFSYTKLSVNQENGEKKLIRFGVRHLSMMGTVYLRSSICLTTVVIRTTVYDANRNIMVMQKLKKKTLHMIHPLQKYKVKL